MAHDKTERQPPYGAIGRWLPTVTPGNTKPGRVVWRMDAGGISRKTYTAIVADRPAATIQQPDRSGLWSARIEGWVWDLSMAPGSPAAKMGVKESPVMAFPNVRSAKTAVAVAFQLLEKHLAEQSSAHEPTGCVS